MYMGRLTGLSGLGAKDCPQPVPTEERDALRKKLSNIAFHYSLGRTQSRQIHEDHPDIKKIMTYIQVPVRWLERRPKKLRCDKKARNIAEKWIDDARRLGRLIKRKVPGRGEMTVIPAGGVTFKSWKGKSWHIRGPYWGHKFQAIPNGEATGKPTTEIAPPPSNGKQLPELPPAAAGMWSSLTSGEIYGVPKIYLTYGILGLVGYNFLFGKGRR